MENKNKLAKFKEWIDFASKGLTHFDFELLILCAFLVNLFEDLNFRNAQGYCITIVLMICVWSFGTLICYVIYYFMKKRNEKKELEKKEDIEK